MKETTFDRALKLLRESYSENLSNIDSLFYLKEDDELGEIFESDGALIIFDKDSFCWMIPLSGTWNWSESLEFLISNHPDVKLNIDVQKFPEQVREKIKAGFASHWKFKRTKQDYVYTGDSAPGVKSDCVRLLTPEDRDLFIDADNAPHEDEQFDYRPPRTVLFNVLHRQGGGIFGYFDGEALAGYLAYMPLAEGLDVDFVFTNPDRRRCGIGRALTVAYVDFALSRGQMAYYSNAKGEWSPHTARSARFVTACETFVFEKN